ncbi:putative ABC transporter ATP-binding protein YxlF [Polystyrenella longa]|uniref:Putative ABC transporter ATP-binding protein YxlF n=1 Tax=Polystyrenella longa TaxID=2528007 RepID=A0A518CHT1_9PLAN|nr:ABC transporter ATP-binding protein [Polystyrenella longa]QDU78782.1 putative ABC transporter ATP-binding protein YxlF [Polystyrenella longa]
MSNTPSVENTSPESATELKTGEPGSLPAIEMKGVSHRFKDHNALDGVTFNVPQGALHGFVGPNGAGKTTSLKLICTLLKPQTGQVRVMGKSVTTHVKEVRQLIGFMPDHFSSYRQMTVFEYLDFFGAAYGLSMRRRNEVIDDILELTDMAGRQQSLVGGLSRGMQQRVSLARVLINDPQLLLLDEPASGLDPRARIELMEILQALQEMGKTIFISSHILKELEELCDSVTIIDRGRIKYSGTMDDLRDHGHENIAYRIQLVNGTEDPIETLLGIQGVVSADSVGKSRAIRIVLDENQIDSNRLLSELIQRNITITSFEKEQRQLNQAFMDLTEQGVR